MINCEPNIIERDLMWHNICIICVYKTCKYLCDEVMNGNSHGIKCKQWVELVNNKIYNTVV